MGRGRRCHYKDCGHNEADNRAKGQKCKFYVLPKDRVQAAQWLELGSVEHLTPRRVTAHNCFLCSCHFPNGKENGPAEYVEECDFDDFAEESIDQEVFARKRSAETRSIGTVSMPSPPVKNRRVAELTPSSKLAVEALVMLTNEPEPELEPAENNESFKKSPAKRVSSLSYSPQKLLWRIRGHYARESARKTLYNLMEAESQMQESRSELSADLGVEPIISPSPSLHFSDENNNVDKEMGSKLLASTFEESNSFLPQSANEIAAPSPSGFPEAHVNSEVKSFNTVGTQCDLGFLCYAKARLMPENDFKIYTGLSQSTFEVLYEFLGGDAVCNYLKYEYDANTPKREPFAWKLTAKDKLFLTLLRLRRGVPYVDLKGLFNISKYHASRICFVWIRFMNLQFKILEERMFTSAAAQNLSKPRCFEKFPNLRIIIDATEFKIQHPTHFQQQNNTYSAYKSGNTMKYLVGISCFGGLSFISDGYEGSISDRQLLIDSGLMDRLHPHDAIMADRGFDCEDLCDEREVDLLIPAFLDQRTHFTARELLLNRAIATSRIHVETFIGKIKQFRLVRFVIPNSMLPIANDIVRTCAFLVNFQQPFISDKNNDDDDE